MTAPRKPRRKAATPALRPADTRAVTFAYTMTVDGVEYAPDSTNELPARVARALVQSGRARWAAKEERA